MTTNRASKRAPSTIARDTTKGQNAARAERIDVTRHLSALGGGPEASLTMAVKSPATKCPGSVPPGETYHALRARSRSPDALACRDAHR